MKRVLLFVAVAALGGCASADEHLDAQPDTTIPTPQSASPATTSGTVSTPATPSDDYKLEDGEQRFEGVYGAANEPDDEKHRMRFEGTFVKLDDGGQLILSYGPDKEHASLIGKRVIVIGTVYHPEGRAVGGTHVKARVIAEKK